MEWMAGWLTLLASSACGQLLPAHCRDPMRPPAILATSDDTFRIDRHSTDQVVEEASAVELSCSTNRRGEMCSWRRLPSKDDIGSSKEWCNVLLPMKNDSVFCQRDERIEFKSDGSTTCTIAIKGVVPEDSGWWRCKIMDKMHEETKVEKQQDIRLQVMSPFYASLELLSDHEEPLLRCSAVGRGCILPQLLWSVNGNWTEPEANETRYNGDETILFSNLSTRALPPGAYVRCLARLIHPTTSKIVFENFASIFTEGREGEFALLAANVDYDVIAGVTVVVCAFLGFMLFFFYTRGLACFERKDRYQDCQGGRLGKRQTAISIQKDPLIGPEVEVEGTQPLLTITSQGEREYVRLVKLNSPSLPRTPIPSTPTSQIATPPNRTPTIQRSPVLSHRILPTALPPMSPLTPHYMNSFAPSGPQSSSLQYVPPPISLPYGASLSIGLPPASLPYEQPTSTGLQPPASGYSVSPNGLQPPLNGEATVHYAYPLHVHQPQYCHLHHQVPQESLTTRRRQLIQLLSELDSMDQTEFSLNTSQPAQEDRELLPDWPPEQRKAASISSCSIADKSKSSGSSHQDEVPLPASNWPLHQRKAASASGGSPGDMSISSECSQRDLVVIPASDWRLEPAKAASISGSSLADGSSEDWSYLAATRPTMPVSLLSIDRSHSSLSEAAHSLQAESDARGYGQHGSHRKQDPDDSVTQDTAHGQGQDQVKEDMTKHVKNMETRAEEMENMSEIGSSGGHIGSNCSYETHL